MQDIWCLIHDPCERVVHPLPTPPQSCRDPQVENCWFRHSQENNVCGEGVHWDSSAETHKTQVAKRQCLSKWLAHVSHSQPVSWLALGWCRLSSLFSRGLYLQVHSGKEETFTVEEGSALKGCKLGASSLGTVGRIPQCWLRQAGSPAYLRDTLALNYAE